MYILRKGVAKLSDLADGASVHGYPGDYPGRQYFVNNIVGSDGADGLDWGNPMDEVSTAITASEAFRTSRKDATDRYIRNQIFVQGTGTAYEALTALPSHCDIIGVGDDPRGNGAGIARIGEDTGSGGGVVVTSSVRGLNMVNLQLQAGVSNYPFKGTNLFRSRFDNVVFTSNGSPEGQCAAGFELAIASGVVWKDCLWNNQSSLTVQHLVGMNITGTHFHGCLVVDSHLSGDVGVAIASGCINGWGSMFKDSFIGWGGDTCDIGVDDNATVGHIMYVNLYVFATDAFDLAHNGAGRIIGCTMADGLVT